MNFKFIIVSKDQNFSISSEVEDKIRSNSSHQIQLIKLENNKLGLAEVYNKYLSIERNEKKNDFIGFMHADVNVDIVHLCDHIQLCKDKYDVFGLCGTSTMNVSQSPLNWWTGSNPTPEAKWGFVIHGELNNKASFFNHGDRESIEDHEVACIDGLCIVLGRRAIESGIEFDPIFKFDMYDTDFSFQTILKYHLKLGVVVEKTLQHFSVGKSIMTNDFLAHELDFRRKWNLDIPNGSKLQQMIDNKSITV